MYLNEQYKMYRLAYELVNDNGYEVLHLSNETEEIWLEKHVGKVSKVVRILHQGFDWKNYLKTDIARVFQKTKVMKKSLLGKTIEISNIYISAHTPIDAWDILKKPLHLNEKNPIKMKVYYIEEHNIREELARFANDSGVLINNDYIGSENGEVEREISGLKKDLVHALENKQDQINSVFTYGKPFITYGLIVINIFMFIILELNGGSANTETLISFGAKHNIAIINGEWWRIISSMFLHVGFIHLFMNMLALYYLGATVERIYGSKRFFIIYLLAGVGGGLASFAFTFNVSAGASGAIFGLFGALLFFGLIHKQIFRQTIGRGILLVIGFNVIFGFVVPQIDNSAHLGGLFAGFVASAIVHLPKNKNIRIQIISLVLYFSLIIGLVTFGLQTGFNKVSYEMNKVDTLIQQNEYESAILIATEQLESPNIFEAQLLFLRSYAYIELNETQLAIKDLEKCIQVNDELPEAYYNIALLYTDENEIKEAKEAINNAVELRPEEAAYLELYEQIYGEPID